MQIWSPLLRRFCQIPADASNLLKNVASALSARISFLVGNGKLALSMFMFTSLVLSATAKFVNKERNRSVAPYVLCSLAAFWSPPTHTQPLFHVWEEHFACISLQAYLTHWDKTTHSVATHLPKRCSLIYTRWEPVSSSSSTVREELPREDQVPQEKASPSLAALPPNQVSSVSFSLLFHTWAVLKLITHSRGFVFGSC